MGASVARDMPSGSVALASQTEVYEADDRRARALKKLYFKIETPSNMILWKKIGLFFATSLKNEGEFAKNAAMIFPFP